MNNSKLKYFFIGIVTVIIIILLGIIALQLTRITNSTELQNNLNLQEKLSPEEIKSNTIEQEEKKYKDLDIYQCYKDENYGIRFYYNSEKMKYDSELASSGKLPLKEVDSDTAMLYTSYPKTYNDENEVVQNYINTKVSTGYTITENKNITISKITPIEARCVVSENDKIIMESYMIFTDNGLCNFTFAYLSGTEPQYIQEIFDSIIIE